MAEVLRFRLPPWFDPVPPFLIEKLDIEKLMAITKAQLVMQKSILLAQQRAINETLRILG